MARARADVVPVVDGIGVERVVVPGQDDDGLGEPVELGLGESDRLVGHAVVIEEVAGDQQQIDAIGEGSIDHAPERAAGALVVRRLLPGISVPIAAEVHVGGVEQAQGSSG